MAFMKEPSVLDYILSLLTPWKGKPLKIPVIQAIEDVEESPQEIVGVLDAKQIISAVPRTLSSLIFAWVPIFIFGLGVIAQLLLEPPGQAVIPAIILYALSAALLLTSLLSNHWTVDKLGPESNIPMPMNFKPIPFVIGLGLAFLAFILFTDNRFTAVNLVVWGISLGLLLVSLLTTKESTQPLIAIIKNLFSKTSWKINVTRWTVLVILALITVVFFRFSRLGQVPGEMFSDHAEKLYDVAEILLGKTPIFFPRNTGREAFQMYLTAAVGIIFNTGLSFLSLKIGTALAGILTLPFIYLLGKEISGKWVGLTAFFLAGIAYWPNVISRVGLRFPLYPLFVAPTLYFLIRALRRRQRNDFLWAGLALGVGLHGYSPVRILPVVVVVAIILYILHRQSQVNRRTAVTGLILIALISLIIFLPLLRYAIENPEMFTYRTLSRLSGSERELSGSWILIFIDNFWKSMLMFFFNNGSIWVHSIPDRPALDVITAVYYFIGVLVLSYRYFRDKNWLDLFLLISIPLLMLPSTLSLAFPEENPSLNRSGGAIIPVFIIAAIGLENCISNLRNRLKNKSAQKNIIRAVGILLTGSILINYNLVFNQFDKQFISGAWNTSQIGSVIQSFGQVEGSTENTFVVPFPYWVDTRLVGINAGDPLRDYAIWPEQFETTIANPEPKLFILNPNDQISAQQLSALYPTGAFYNYPSGRIGKDFILFFVPRQ